MKIKEYIDQKINEEVKKRLNEKDYFFNQIHIEDEKDVKKMELFREQILKLINKEFKSCKKNILTTLFSLAKQKFPHFRPQDVIFSILAGEQDSGFSTMDYVDYLQYDKELGDS